MTNEENQGAHHKRRPRTKRCSKHGAKRQTAREAAEPFPGSAVHQKPREAPAQRVGKESAPVDQRKSRK